MNEIKPIVWIFYGIFLLPFFLKEYRNTIFSIPKNLKTLIQKRNFQMKGFILLFISTLSALAYFAHESVIKRFYLINDVVGLYLSLEPIFAIILLFFYIWGLLFYQINSKTYFTFFNKGFLTMTLLSLVSHHFNRNFHFQKSLFILISVVLFLFLLLAFNEHQLIEPSIIKKKDLFSPKDYFEDLFPRQKYLVKELKNYILHSQTFGISCILVSGQWGSGKTSIINGTIDLLKGEKGKHYIIRINSLELDDLTSLFYYLFHKIEIYLREEGVYIGIASEYKDFMLSSLNTITKADFSKLPLFLSKNRDHRMEKEKLEALLDRVLGEDDRIVILVDDIERCLPDRILQYIFFVKEVASFPKCIALFVSDYDMLLEVCKDRIPTDDFFDKFFHQRFQIFDSDEKEMAEWLKNELPENINILEIMQADFYTGIMDIKKEIEDMLEKEREKIEKGNKIISSYDLLDVFMKPFHNPRKFLKIYQTYYVYCSVLKKQYEECGHKLEILKKYSGSIKLNQLVLLAAYFHVNYPIEFNLMQSQSIEVYSEKILANSKDVNRLSKEERLFLLLGLERLFTDLTLNIIFNKNSDFYIIQKSCRFFNGLIQNSNELGKYVNGFTRFEDEWFNALDKGNICGYETHASKIFRNIFEAFDYNNSEKGEAYLIKLFEGLKNTEINIWEIFFTNKNERVVAGNIRFMQLFYEYYIEKGNINTLVLPEVSLLNIFLSNYSYHRIKSHPYLIYFFIKYLDNEILQNEILDSWNNETDFYEFLDKFREEMEKNRIIDIPNTMFEYHGLHQFEEFRKRIEKYVCEKGLDKLASMQDFLHKMNSEIEELIFAMKIYDFVVHEKEGLRSENKFTKISPDELLMKINFLKNRLEDENIRYNKEFIEEGNELIRKIQASSLEGFKSEELVEIYGFIREFSKKTDPLNLFFREILQQEIEKK